MQFLADVVFSCPECQGRRFVGPVLDVEYMGLNIADVLELTAQQAAEHFGDDAILSRALRPLLDVGLGYLRLGQPLNTLSGGEAQRLKLAEALLRATPGSLLIFDEPTAGLHANDIEPLMKVLGDLVARGDTVIVVEHDMHVAAHADYVIDLGPGAGDGGGRIVAKGSPETVAKKKSSQTAPYLARALGKSKGKRAAAAKKTKASTAPLREIRIAGAREHNLKNITVHIPRDQLVVVTGPSGSGKSTLAFDVLFAEGQRRYLETLSPYARQYMPQLPRPAVDQVVGVPPSVSLEQRMTRAGANSTVATVTEVSHYLRLIWARIGVLHCVDCEVPIAARPATQLVHDVKRRFGSKKLTLLAPVVRGRKGIHRELFKKAMKDGFSEARIDGKLRRLEPGMKLDRYIEHDVELVVGRAGGKSTELLLLLEKALEVGGGAAWAIAGKDEMQLSSKQACPNCGRGYPELDPRFFSFNTRQGQCPACEGRGEIIKKSWRGRRRKRAVEKRLCDQCEQTRLSPLARGVTVDEMSITTLFDLSVSEAVETLGQMDLRGRDAIIAKTPLQEALRRLSFLEEVGLGYLGLGRTANTLSGGEMQRVRLGAACGTARQWAHRRALRPRRTDHRPTPARHRTSAHRTSRPRRSRKLGAGRRARRRHHSSSGSRHRCWTRGRQIRRAGFVARHAAQNEGVGDSGCPRAAAQSACQTPNHARGFVVGADRSNPPQPRERRRSLPPRALRDRDGRQRLRKELFGAGGAATGDPRGGWDGQRLSRRRAREDQRLQIVESGHRDRPEPDRAYATFRSCDVHRPLEHGASAPSGDARSSCARLHRKPLLVQRGSGPVPGVQGPGLDSRGDVVSPRRRRSLRDLQRDALHARDPRSALARPQCRRAARAGSRRSGR
ncbi:MAG: hypothetical protein JRF42_16500, partial [Deltaproteobacteria bacterium]|nr:hypothetical protein [Deltaproteobacteria bacterium]